MHTVVCAVVADRSPTIPNGRYSATELTTRVAAILSPSGFLQSTEEDSDAPVGLVLERTPFYAEQGGQVADTGSITSTSGAHVDVQDTQVGSATQWRPHPCSGCQAASSAENRAWPRALPTNSRPCIYRHESVRRLHEGRVTGQADSQMHDTILGLMCDVHSTQLTLPCRWQPGLCFMLARCGASSGWAMR